MAKRKITHHRPEQHTTQYMGIGHTGGGVIWAYVNGTMWTWEAEKVLGLMHKDLVKNYEDYWRGRFETHTGKLSVIAPNGLKAHRPPSWLMDKLETEFGGDLEVYGFNPVRK